MRLSKGFLWAVTALSFSAVSSAQISVDGQKGSEWTGISPVLVPKGSSPSSTADLYALEVYSRSDESYFYGLILALPEDQSGLTGIGAVNFANVYFDTNPGTGSDLGFELGNNRAFKPGVAGYYNDIFSQGVRWANDLPTTYAPGVVAGYEFAVPWAYFLNDPQGVGFPDVTPGSEVQFRTVQAYNYNFINGNNVNPGPAFGRFTAVPEPGTMIALGAALAGLVRRRRNSK